MPVVGYPVAVGTITRDDVRRFMRDFPGPIADTGVINVLLDNVEFSDTDLDAALNYTVDFYNAMTPITNVSFTYLPRVILLYGIAAHLMTSEGIRQLRNQATVQDGNVQPIGIDDKHSLYMQWSQYLRQQYNELARAFKNQKNMESAFGGMSSGYLNVTRFTRS
jgi:hypothetical protein